MEVIYLIGVEVLGKGKDYSGSYEFHPHDTLDSLRYKVPFFKTFAHRGYELVGKDSQDQFTDFKKELSDLGLKTGSKLVMREQSKMHRE